MDYHIQSELNKFLFFGLQTKTKWENNWQNDQQQQQKKKKKKTHSNWIIYISVSNENLCSIH